MSSSPGKEEMPHPAFALAVERAKSARAMCRTCREKIDKGEIRWVKSFEDSSGRPMKQMNHLACFRPGKPMASSITVSIALLSGYTVEAELCSGGVWVGDRKCRRRTLRLMESLTRKKRKRC